MLFMSKDCACLFAKDSDKEIIGATEPIYLTTRSLAKQNLWF